jgi:DNA-binding MarR family transcriptional regulator
MEFISQLGLIALGSRMRALSERLYALADEVYDTRGLGIHGRWFPVLRLLHAQGPSTVGAIAQQIGQTHSAVSQLADRLLREGWLESVPDHDDRRRRRVALSNKALAALREARPAWRAIEEVLAERCAAEGIDLLDVLARFEGVLAQPLGRDIVARAKHHDREAVRIVPFTPALREHFRTLNEAWLRKYFYVEEIDHRVLSRPEAEILQPGGAILFAMHDESVVGTCALKREAPGIFELTKMAVDESHQGLGIGRLLLGAAIEEFQRMHGKRLFLETSSRLGPALRLYESMGFVRQPAIKPDSHYVRADVYMVWGAKRGVARRARRDPVRR